MSTSLDWTVRLPRDLRDRLTPIAREELRDPSNMVRKLVEEALFQRQLTAGKAMKESRHP
jgi:hypothetical protein